MYCATHDREGFGPIRPARSSGNGSAAGDGPASAVGRHPRVSHQLHVPQDRGGLGFRGVFGVLGYTGSTPKPESTPQMWRMGLVMRLALHNSCRGMHLGRLSRPETLRDHGTGYCCDGRDEPTCVPPDQSRIWTRCRPVFGQYPWHIGRCLGGTLVAVVVALWSLLSWHAGRCCRGALVAVVGVFWSPAGKIGCAGWGACDNLQRSGPAVAG